MSDKFKDVPVENDTKILGNDIILLDDMDVLHQSWSWDGIAAESLIFVASDVSNLNDEEIEEKAKASGLFEDDSGVTVKHSESGFVFVNFNFKT